jgi:hypothetical protein
MEKRGEKRREKVGGRKKFMAFLRCSAKGGADPLWCVGAVTGQLTRDQF